MGLSMLRGSSETLYGFVMSSMAIPSEMSFTIEPLPLLEELEPQWRHLDALGSHSFFLTWTWIGTWLRCVKQLEGFKLVRLLSGSNVVGLSIVRVAMSQDSWGPSFQQVWLNSTGESGLDGITIEHNGFALAPNVTQVPWLEFSDWFLAQNIGTELIIPGLDTSAFSGPENRLLAIQECKSGYRIPLQQAAFSEGALSPRSRNARQKLRRSIRDFQAKGVILLEVAQSEESAQEYFSGLKELHIASWARRGRRHAFSKPFFEPFHRTLINRGMSEHSVELMRISAGTNVLGYLYNFRRNNNVLSYQSGFDDSVRCDRPGYVCHALAIAHYATDGAQYYDFLAESNRLKRSFALEQYQMSWWRLRKPTFRFRAESLARKFLNQFRRPVYDDGEK
jgi:CelD/BcsL family acetyltransferase involved in cellulose biosynthesis